MACLSIGVVGQQVENAKLLETRMIPRIFNQCEVVLFKVSVNEQLDRTNSVGSNSLNCWRYNIPTQLLT